MGLSVWFGDQLNTVGNLPPVMLVLLVWLLLTFLTGLTSNTATAEMFLPILAALAVAAGLNPLLMMVPGALSCSFAVMLPVAKPPNTIEFAANRVAGSDMARAGIWLNLIVIVTMITLFGSVIGISLAEMPCGRRLI